MNELKHTVLLSKSQKLLTSRYRNTYTCMSSFMPYMVVHKVNIYCLLNVDKSTYIHALNIQSHTRTLNVRVLDYLMHQIGHLILNKL